MPTSVAPSPPASSPRPEGEDRRGVRVLLLLPDIDLTDPDCSPDEKRRLRLAETEHWYRHRTDIKALNRNAKHCAALRHLPSANRLINTVWMHAALIGCAIAACTQEVMGTDHGNGRGRGRADTCTRSAATSTPRS
ncbi:hypothetical protein [Microbacterium sp.]|uniref:hypothetical protein n=1 Tax=Microbacterium sp. TaxID=51671 RepID=UPI003A91FC7D